MKKLFILIVLITIMMSTTGCFATTVPAFLPPVSEQIVLIQGSSVATGIHRALLGAPGTSILQYGDDVLFTWSYAEMNAVGYFAIDMKGKTILEASKIIIEGGKLANAKTVEDIVNNLKANGWTVVTGDVLSIELFWNVAVASCQAIARIPVIFLFMTDDGAGDFLQWYESVYPVEQT